MNPLIRSKVWHMSDQSDLKRLIYTCDLTGFYVGDLVDYAKEEWPDNEVVLSFWGSGDLDKNKKQIVLINGCRQSGVSQSFLDEKIFQVTVKRYFDTNPSRILYYAMIE